MISSSSSSDSEVANFLAQRKAKKANGRKFKTFTATQAFMASESNDQEDGDYVENDVPQQHSIPSSSSNNNNTPTANTLVAGEWIDDETSYTLQPRLMNNGIQVADLETLTEVQDKRSIDIKVQQEDIRKQFHSTRQIALEHAAGVEGQQREDFPTLGGSAWGKVDKDAVRLAKEEELKRKEASKPVFLGKEFIPSEKFIDSKPGYDFRNGQQGLGYYWSPPQQPVENKETEKPAPPSAAAASAAAAAPKPGVWKSRTVLQQQHQTVASGPAAFPSLSRQTPPSVNTPTTSTPSASTATPVLNSDGRDKDGLKRSVNAWQPKRG